MKKSEAIKRLAEHTKTFYEVRMTLEQCAESTLNFCENELKMTPANKSGFVCYECENDWEPEDAEQQKHEA